MTYNLIQELSNVRESDEDDDIEYEKVRARELKVARLILRTFKKIGIDVVSDGKKGVKLKDGDMFGYEISYDESDREACVEFDECTLDKLCLLKDSGLSDKYKISHTRDSLQATFIVDSAIASGKAELN